MGKKATTIERFSKTALLAGAALALPSAQAGVVYSTAPLDATDISSDSNTGDVTLALDVAGDESDQLQFTASFAGLIDTVNASGEYMWLGTSSTTPTDLAAGDTIGPGSSFYSGTGTLQNTVATDNSEGPFQKMKGPWPTDGASTGYLGLQITQGANTYYGWVQLSACTYENYDSPAAPCDDPASTIGVVDYAYETNPNTSIFAGQTSDTPEPSSLALFALGAAGLAAFRLRRKQTA